MNDNSAREGDGTAANSVGDSDRVPWNELANLIQDEFDVNHTEASNLADNALGSDWRAP